MVLEGAAGACAELRTSTEEVEALWAAEPKQPSDLSYWDQAHVPQSLWTQTTRTTELIQIIATWLSLLAAGH